MISAQHRQKAVELIDEAARAGAGRDKACKLLGIHVRTYQRWTRGGEVATDGRPTASRPAPANRLSQAEREKVLACCHDPQFASLPPSQIVPKLADRDEYIASESTFYRVLREAGEQQHRGRAQAPRRRAAPTTHCASGPSQVWSWDITWLPGPAKGIFYYLYLILDIYSRKIVGWEVYDQELTANAAAVVERAVLAEGCLQPPRVLHSDNGSPMKGSTLLATLERLGVQPSYSRPRVSNDNPYSEAIFRTCKYRPCYPRRGFPDVAMAQAWVLAFARWYNHEHCHSGIRFVTPNARHEGHDVEILRRRQAVYEQAKARHPERWTRAIRNWQPVGVVMLNPDRDIRGRSAPQTG